VKRQRYSIFLLKNLSFHALCIEWLEVVILSRLLISIPDLNSMPLQSPNTPG
jgi:hypothetical protein